MGKWMFGQYVLILGFEDICVMKYMYYNQKLVWSSILNKKVEENEYELKKTFLFEHWGEYKLYGNSKISIYLYC